MKISVLLVGAENKRFIAAANEAATLAFPGAVVAGTPSLKEALGTAPAPAPQLLVLAAADATELAQAVHALDADRLPRWAVVAMGGAAPVPLAEVIPDSEWIPSVLARAFRSAVSLHLMHRERERLRGDLLSVGIRVAHDLRSPVGGIVSSTEVIEACLPPGTEPGKSLTKPVIDSTNDLVRIIGQLALVAKASARPDSSQQFNMAVPVSRALDRVEMRVREKGAVITRPKSWPDAKGDETYTEAIWVGLLENAIRHSGNVPRIEVGWEAVGDGHKFWVRDAGDGIPEKKRPLLFRPFHRLHEPSAPRGLGLAIIERLVTVQGGQCGYEFPAPGKSAFFFTLSR